MNRLLIAVAVTAADQLGRLHKAIMRGLPNTNIGTKVLYVTGATRPHCGLYKIGMVLLVTTLAAGGTPTARAQALAPGTMTGWGYYSREAASTPGLSDVKAIAGGANFGLALKSDGTVVGWGDSNQGQTSPPEGLNNVKAIAAGGSHSLALKGDGTVVAWGYHEQGQATVPAGLTNVRAIAAGWSHSLAVKGDGTVVAWGANNNGQATVPADLTGVIAVAGGDYHSLALKGDGTVVAWGYNDKGQTDVPAGLTNVKAIVASTRYNLALKGDGTVVAWGRGASDGIHGETTVPANLTDVKAIAAGWYHNLAVKSDGTVVAWGSNSRGQTNIPADLTGVTAVAAGAAHSLAANQVVEAPLLSICIDIKPGLATNEVNPNVSSPIPVAVLSTSTFDASTLRIDSTRFGAEGLEVAASSHSINDANGDGLNDVVFQFPTTGSGLTCTSTTASLTGLTVGGQRVEGKDAVQPVGCNAPPPPTRPTPPRGPR